MEMPFDIVKALLSLRPNGIFSLVGNEYDNITWSDENESSIPTELEIYNECVKLREEWENNQYQLLRAQKYPSIGDQLDALFHAGVFPEEMAAKIQAVKDNYPKP